MMSRHSTPSWLRALLIALATIPATTGVARAQTTSPPTASTMTPGALVKLGAGEIGLSPEGVVIAGLEDSCSTILQRLAAQQQACMMIVTQRMALSEALAEQVEVVAALNTSPSDPALQTQLQAAEAAVAAASSALETSRTALRETVLTGISNEATTALDLFNSSMQRQVPPSFRVASRTPEQWRNIELALIAEKRALRLGRELAPQHAQLLAEVRGELDVTAAGMSLSSHLPAVTAAFDAAFAGPGSPG